jgi:hypothetical protein
VLKFLKIKRLEKNEAHGGTKKERGLGRGGLKFMKNTKGNKGGWSNIKRFGILEDNEPHFPTTNTLLLQPTVCVITCTKILQIIEREFC